MGVFQSWENPWDLFRKRVGEYNGLHTFSGKFVGKLSLILEQKSLNGKIRITAKIPISLEKLRYHPKQTLI